MLSLLAALAEAETFVDIARFGSKKLDFLWRFLPFPCGTPSHDHLGDVFAALDAEKFQHCLTAWVAAWASERTVVIAIDDKTVRRSGKKGSHDAVHVVSAFVARQRLVLGRVKVVGKSNEIIAIPKLLEMLDIESAIVSVYAMGCQRDITLNIIDKGADYLLAPKVIKGPCAKIPKCLQMSKNSTISMIRPLVNIRQ